jgi:hypothetical protein
MVSEVMTICCERLALGEVIQRAKLILQFLQRRQRRFAPLGVLLPRKDTGKELDRVAQIFCPDAELMALLGAEWAQVDAVLPDPLPSAGHKFGGMVGDFLSRRCASVCRVSMARPRSIRRRRARRYETCLSAPSRPLTIGLGAGLVEGAAGFGESCIAG